MTVRKAERQDIEHVRTFYQMCGYNGDVGEADVVVVAVEKSEILGAARLCFEEAVGVLRGMQVHPAHRGLGIGTRLLAECVVRIFDRDCYCLPYSYLEGFYSGFGFFRIPESELPCHLRARLEEYRFRHLSIIPMKVTAENNPAWNARCMTSRVMRLLTSFAEEKQLGIISGSEAGYRCFPDDPTRVRKPDVSFVQMDRLPEERELEGYPAIAPDLAVEVISPNDIYAEVEAKVDEYLAAGVPLVWVVSPATRSVRVHRADGTVTDLNEADVLSGESVVPGFACAVTELFALPRR